MLQTDSGTATVTSASLLLLPGLEVPFLCEAGIKIIPLSQVGEIN